MNKLNIEYLFDYTYELIGPVGSIFLAMGLAFIVIYMFIFHDYRIK